MPETIDVSPAPLDAFLGAAIDIARSALIEDVGADAVGAHRGVVSEHSVYGHAVTHQFDAAVNGYAGWYWAVSVCRAPGADAITVNETVLLPGEGSVTVPEWVPWAHRVRSEDLHPGDLMPSDPYDERLSPGYLASDDPAVEDVAWELGLGRERVLSRLGRSEAAARWRSGVHGGTSAMAKHAPQPCGTCAFYLPLAGSMRAMFGACANEISPADGAVVTADYGCGAHSEATINQAPDEAAAPDLVFDTTAVDVSVVHRTRTPAEVLAAVCAEFARTHPPKKSTKLSRTKRH